MNNINFNWDNNGFIKAEPVAKVIKPKEIYATIEKGGIIYLSTRHKPEFTEVAVGYDSKHNVIVLLDKGTAPKGAPIRRLTPINKGRTLSTYTVHASGLVYALMREGKIKGMGYGNRVHLGISKDKLMIYLGNLKETEND